MVFVESLSSQGAQSMAGDPEEAPRRDGSATTRAES
jgi:hypothetical protein